MAKKTKHTDEDISKVVAYLGPEPLKFFEEQPLYKDLCREVEYILRKRFQRDGVSVGVITSRAKSYKSFADKMIRRVHQDKPNNVRDRAGARVVYLYRSDLPKIEAGIRSEFTVIDKKDSTTDQKPDRFGYSDVKFYIKLRNQAGPRYDDLKDFVCEIQVRTVGQDAWALISRDLMYNRESQIPKEHQKALNLLVGHFEIADKEFDTIRTELLREREKIAAKAEDEFLEQAINLDTLTAFIEKYVATERPIEDGEIAAFPAVVNPLLNSGYKTLKELHTSIKKFGNTIKALKTFLASRGIHGGYYLAMLLEVTVAYSDSDYLEQHPRRSLLETGIEIAKETLQAG